MNPTRNRMTTYKSFRKKMYNGAVISSIPYKGMLLGDYEFNAGDVALCDIPYEAFIPQLFLVPTCILDKPEVSYDKETALTQVKFSGTMTFDIPDREKSLIEKVSERFPVLKKAFKLPKYKEYLDSFETQSAVVYNAQNFELALCLRLSRSITLCKGNTLRIRYYYDQNF